MRVLVQQSGFFHNDYGQAVLAYGKRVAPALTDKGVFGVIRMQRQALRTAGAGEQA